MKYNGIIGCAWIIGAVWLAWGVTSQAWSDRSEGLRTNPSWLIALTLIVCVFTVTAGCAAMRRRKWAIWGLVVVATLVLADTPLCLIMEGCTFEWGTVAFLLLPVLTFFSPLFLRRNEHVV
jgi:hypothetical protein